MGIMKRSDKGVVAFCQLFSTKDLSQQKSTPFRDTFTSTEPNGGTKMCTKGAATRRLQVEEGVE